MSQSSDAIEPGQPGAAPPTPQARLIDIFIAFAKAGLSGLGGGLSSWIMLEIVRRRRWLTEKEFLNGYGIAQALPGVNVVNLSIWFGYQLRGPQGAVAGAAGMIVPTTILALIVVATISQFMQVPWVQAVVVGAGAASIGMTLYVITRSVRAIGLDYVRLGIGATMFVLLFVFKLPLIPVFLVGAPVSIAIAYWRLRRAKDA